MTVATISPPMPIPAEETDFSALLCGHVYGIHTLELSSALVADWCRLYGVAIPHNQTMPAGMASVISIRTFMALIPVRPPGGVHAGQTFEIQELPKIGERLLTSMTCARKESKGGRLWVDLEMECEGEDGRRLFRGKHVALWAR